MTDYLETTVQLIFSPFSPRRQCADVAIVQNDILEGDESFLAQLLPTDGETIIMNPATATVTITDQDCKCSLLPYLVLNIVIFFSYSCHSFISRNFLFNNRRKFGSSVWLIVFHCRNSCYCHHYG